ncbi:MULTISPECIES: recombinase RecT [unclassified Streptomyces]|uniref:recombinase RecT n=1 Tax=unclassified Streptomyces TaxID=2593676 RepID=UPI002024C4BC|nr:MULTISPECIES: recombinase RecT [unclassified Streptomyces]MCX4550537.1 recombinase RecT [Streptomyces sp. NBC_01500]WSC21984.1 recombinase RecT [Streptomyces sp. NBC_01766]
MALSTLKDRVRAATSPTGIEAPTVEATVTRAAAAPQQSMPDELHTSAQSEGGDIADVALNWLERYGNEFTKALPSHIDSGAFFSAVRAALPGLVRCTPASLLQALLTCARFGLIPDGRHAVIRREGKTAQFVPMAQGYVELMYRSGRVGSVHVGMIHEGDEWNYEPTAPAPLDFTHRPNLSVPKARRGEAILAYAFCWMESGARSQVVILTREDAEAIRDEYSQAYRRANDSGANDSFWHTDFLAMWRKSGLRRLNKVVPMSAELVALLKADDAGDAGQVQVVHAPVEKVRLQAEADEAHARAEESQDPQDARVRPLPRKRSQPKRTTRTTRKKSSRR